mmetsp:Transcript_23451/g.26293  ORF Transcript_23451/g.26293 Transcript_23451/m.26293 type:complete len:255 (+) Transcript_23451:408-1172(+)
MQIAVMLTPAKRAPFNVLPLFVVSNILTIEHSSSQQCAWNMAWKPAVMIRVFSGISTINISQITLSTARHGGFVHITKPLRTSSVPAPASLISTFSPGRAAATGSSFAHTASTLYSNLVGISVTFIPGRITPLSTFPMAIVPRSVYRSRIGIRKGAVASRPLISRVSKRLRSVGAVVLLSPFSQHFLHQGQIDESTSSFTLDPANPDRGINLTSLFITKPHDFKNGRSFLTHSSYRSFDQLTVGSSILLITTTM